MIFAPLGKRMRISGERASQGAKSALKERDSANGQKRQANERIGEQTRMKQGVRLDERQKRGKLPAIAAERKTRSMRRSGIMRISGERKRIHLGRVSSG